VNPDPGKAERFIAQAVEALDDIGRVRSSSVRFDIAYNIAHDAAEALLAAYGLRTAAGVGQHVTLGEVLVIILGEKSTSVRAAEEFDPLRQTRNQLRYQAWPAGTEPSQAAETTAAELLLAVRRQIDAG
jgi:hypothetical protein